MDFVGGTNTINIITFDLIDFYSFIPVSGCVGIGPGAPGHYFALGPLNAVKTTLNAVRHYVQMKIF